MTNFILIGLGGTGGKVLRAFKMRMFEEYPDMKERAKLPISLLYVDSSREMMPKDGKALESFKVLGQDASFTESEFLDIKSVDIDYILKNPDHYPQLKGLITNADAVKKAIGVLGEAAGQKRRAGRLLFATNAGKYVSALKNAYARCTEISGSVERTDVYIIAGLSGGTGSGSIIDAIVQTRKALPEAKIQVMAMMPELILPKQDIDKGQYYPNAFAALNELNALQAGRWNPWDVTGNGPSDEFRESNQGVANGITLYSNVNENGLTIDSLNELPKIVGDYLYARIFDIKDNEQDTHDLIRSFTCENAEKFSYEFDETDDVLPTDEARVARSKKINSFGIKRVMYPETRILQHITYTLAEKILYQIKYNNWRENEGYVEEMKNRDYKQEYFSDDKLSGWMIDEPHLTLDLPILDSAPQYTTFRQYWHDKAIGWAEECKNASCPLNELDDTLANFYANHFRDQGVEKYFSERAESIPAFAKEIRHKIEASLFQDWKDGKLSINDLNELSALLQEYINKMADKLEQARVDSLNAYQAIQEDAHYNVTEWSRLGILQRLVGKGAQRYAEHQNILAELYTVKTRIVALDFALRLISRLKGEMIRMDKEITDFSSKVNGAIKTVEKLLVAQQKVNKGLEDMRGAIIEVCEDEKMEIIEDDYSRNKTEMPNYAAQVRDAIIPQSDFVNFGKLAESITEDNIKQTFNRVLPEIIRKKQAQLGEGDTKVLGLNILTQLQQKLPTDDAIKEFAAKIAKQSGVYLKLDTNQLNLYLRNNEGDNSPAIPASRNIQSILISFPTPEKGNETQKHFVEKLKTALNQSFSSDNSVIKFSNGSRKDELSIITIRHTFPMRAVTSIAEYKKRYDKYVNSGNSVTDTKNSILLYSEGTGEGLPSLFAITDPVKKPATRQPVSGLEPISPVTPPPLPGSNIPIEKPISVTLAINGQTYGPYDRETCKQLVGNKQLTPETLVWMEGMPTWAKAGEVEVLKSLFAPVVPPVPGMPPLPPMPGSIPPPLV